VRYEKFVSLGMNEDELRRNPRLDEYVLQNLNRYPKLPFAEAEFDGVGICVSIDYLIRPIEVLREVGRILKVGHRGLRRINVEEVKKELDALSEGDLKKVRAYEEDHKNRKTLLEQLERKSGDRS
jgi:ubiquinone/menaquinone biosynthesis C-methylase UbiE